MHGKNKGFLLIEVVFALLVFSMFATALFSMIFQYQKKQLKLSESRVVAQTVKLIEQS